MSISVTMPHCDIVSTTYCAVAASLLPGIAMLLEILVPLLVLSGGHLTGSGGRGSSEETGRRARYRRGFLPDQGDNCNQEEEGDTFLWMIDSKVSNGHHPFLFQNVTASLLLLWDHPRPLHPRLECCLCQYQKGPQVSWQGECLKIIFLIACWGLLWAGHDRPSHHSCPLFLSVTAQGSHPVPGTQTITPFIVDND